MLSEIIYNSKYHFYNVAILYTNSNSNSSIYTNFYINYILLRPFSIIMILNTIFWIISLLFGEKYSASILVSSCFTFLTPTSIALMTYSFFIIVNNDMVIVCVLISIYVVTTIAKLSVCMFGCTQSVRSHVIMQHSKHIRFILAFCMIAVCISVVSMLFLNRDTDSIKITPICGIAYFNFTQTLFIVCFEATTNRNRKKNKYTHLFCCICYINVVNLIYCFIFIIREFGTVFLSAIDSCNMDNKLANYSLFAKCFPDNGIYYICAYTLSCSFIWFALWALEQFAPWTMSTNHNDFHKDNSFEQLDSR